MNRLLHCCSSKAAMSFIIVCIITFLATQPVVSSAFIKTTTTHFPFPKQVTLVKNSEDPFEFFDPRVSPHLYPNGIPSNNGEDKETTSSAEVSAPTTNVMKKVGILLIDHGSRRPESNYHLRSLAEAYQTSSRCPNHFIVRAAHMEIASPNIEDGIRDLIAMGAARIVCHPYFLSPGRHATEDVPRLIDEAMQSVGRPDVRVVTTDPIGTRVGLLVNAIGDLVEEEMRTGFGKDDDGLGFFGDVMRMMEQQMD